MIASLLWASDCDNVDEGGLRASVDWARRGSHQEPLSYVVGLWAPIEEVREGIQLHRGGIICGNTCWSLSRSLSRAPGGEAHVSRALVQVTLCALPLHELSLHINLLSPTSSLRNVTMAVLDTVPGVSVTVNVDGEPLQEYPDCEDDGEPEVNTCFVEATTGKEFEVLFRFEKGIEADSSAFEVRIMVDGTETDSTLVDAKRARVHGEHFQSTGRQISRTELAKYRFAPLETISDGCQMSDSNEKLDKDLGTIQVKMWHAKNLRLGSEIRVYSRGSVEQTVNRFSETVLKGQALSHRMAYSKPVKSGDESDVYAFDVIGGKHAEPAATFVFCYRSSESLKYSRIIPRTPPPEPLEERDIDSLSREELIELQNQVKAAKLKESTFAKLKRELSDDSSRPRKVHRPDAGSL